MRLSATRTNVALYLLLAGATLLLILLRLHGHFVYSLDDPYIHLALAERIRHGFYGLNAGEPASPSSSLLWPFLFAPFAGSAAMPYLPLVVNVVCGTLAAGLLGRFVDRLAQGNSSAFRWQLLAVLLLFCTNLVGLTFTGLEQLLEVLLCLVCALFCLDRMQGNEPSAGAIAAMILLPSIRYEGLLVTFACAAVLFLTRRRVLGVVVAVAGVLPLLLFGFFLRRHGLPMLPISVLVKGTTVYSHSRNFAAHLLHVAFVNVSAAFTEPERFPTLVLTVASLVLSVKNRRDPVRRTVLLCVTAVGVLQVLYGPFGWDWRYELYAIAFLGPVVLALCIQRGQRAAPPGTLLAAVGFGALTYAAALLTIPQACAAIWLQQAQTSVLLHRFYTGSVAVNDLGMSAFRRPADRYLLDIWALGSPEAFKLYRQSRADHIADLVHDHHIGLVVAYPSVVALSAPPGVWHPLALLCAPFAPIGTHDRSVVLYTTPDSDMAQVVSAITRWKSTVNPADQVYFVKDGVVPECPA